MHINLWNISLSDFRDMGIVKILSKYSLFTKGRYSPFLQQHQDFQYHQEVLEGRQHLGVLQDLLDQEDQVDPTY